MAFLWPFYVIRLLLFIPIATCLVETHFLFISLTALIVRFGLKDRDPNVRNECKALILKLLSDYQNNVPKLLNSLDFEESEEETELLGNVTYAYVNTKV
jgi:hypothetical protein